jgi:hypothetical protein
VRKGPETGLKSDIALRDRFEEGPGESSWTVRVTRTAPSGIRAGEEFSLFR